MTPERLLDVLDEVWEYLDNHADVDDGDDGQPVANHAMRLAIEVSKARDAVSRSIDRANGDH
jgi:hypothetical protein